MLGRNKISTPTLRSHPLGLSVYPSKRTYSAPKPLAD